MGYDDIRAALNRGFTVENLHAITRLSNQLLDSSATGLRHPSAAYAIGAIAQRVAGSWDGIPPFEDASDVVEAHLRPKIEAVLDAAEGETEPLMAALDDLARAFAEARAFLK